jgi:LAS superfamily LD-carboxypeptidase LdcB
MYPSVVTVSITMKIIENHKIEQGTNITKYKYNFDGLYMNIDETQELTQKQADPLKPLETGNETKKDNPPQLTNTAKKVNKKGTRPISKINKNGLDHSLFSKPTTIKDSIGVIERDLKKNIIFKNPITSGL